MYNAFLYGYLHIGQSVHFSPGASAGVCVGGGAGVLPIVFFYKLKLQMASSCSTRPLEGYNITVIMIVCI